MKIPKLFIVYLIGCSMIMAVDPLNAHEIKLEITNGSNQTCTVTNLTNVYNKHSIGSTITGYARITDTKFIGLKIKTDNVFIFNFGDGSGFDYYIGHALYKIEIGNEFIKIDWQDCQYSEPYDLSEGDVYNTHDLFIKYNPNGATGEKFSVKNYSGSYEIMTSGTTIGIWEQGRKKTPYTVPNTCFGAPGIPSGFDHRQISLGGGEYSPDLYWNPRNEYDIKGYQLQRKINSGLWTVLTTINDPADTNHTDWSVIIGGGTNNQYASYKVRSFDIGTLYSGFSPIETVRYHQLEKIGEVSNNSSRAIIQKSFILYPNSPNPFNSSTSISFSLPELADVSITVYNIIGEAVDYVNLDNIESGVHKLQWSRENAPSGIYFLYFEALGINSGKVYTGNNKMNLLK